MMCCFCVQIFYLRGSLCACVWVCGCQHQNRLCWALNRTTIIIQCLNLWHIYSMAIKCINVAKYTHTYIYIHMYVWSAYTLAYTHMTMPRCTTASGWPGRWWAPAFHFHWLKTFTSLFKCMRVLCMCKAVAADGFLRNTRKPGAKKKDEKKNTLKCLALKRICNGK